MTDPRLIENAIAVLTVRLLGDEAAQDQLLIVLAELDERGREIDRLRAENLALRSDMEEIRRCGEEMGGPQ